jgi:hypothetical protein
MYVVDAGLDAYTPVYDRSVLFSYLAEQNVWGFGLGIGSWDTGPLNNNNKQRQRR